MEPLNLFEQKLSASKPVSPGITAQTILFQAGYRAGCRKLRLWQSLCLGLAVLTLVSSGIFSPPQKTPPVPSSPVSAVASRSLSPVSPNDSVCQNAPQPAFTPYVQPYTYKALRRLVTSDNLADIPSSSPSRKIYRLRASTL